MIRFIFIIFISCFFQAPSAWSQVGRCPQLPQDYVWEVAADYEKDRDLVKKTLRWLCVTPLGADIQQRSVANAFVMEWLAGTPSFTIEIKSDYLQFTQEHPELLFTFIHGVGYYMMDHPEEKAELKLYNEGFKVVANLAAQSKELSKSSSLKPLLKAARKNTIRDYTKQILATVQP